MTIGGFFCLPSGRPMNNAFFLGSDDVDGGGEQTPDAKVANSSCVAIRPGNACTTGRVRATDGVTVVVAALAHRRRNGGRRSNVDDGRSVLNEKNNLQSTTKTDNTKNETNVTDERPHTAPQQHTE